jgi:hypothetical protein
VSDEEIDDSDVLSGQWRFYGPNRWGGLREGTSRVTRLWKTQYPLAVRKIGEYAAGLRTMRGWEIRCLIEMPRQRVQPRFSGPEGQGQYLYLN